MSRCAGREPGRSTTTGAGVGGRAVEAPARARAPGRAAGRPSPVPARGRAATRAGACSSSARRWPATASASPRATGPVSAASPCSSVRSSAADSSGRSTADGSLAPVARTMSSADATSVTRWLAPCASPACQSGRSSSGTATGVPPSSATSHSATGQWRPSAVTPYATPGSRGQVSSGAAERLRRMHAPG